MGQNVIGQFVNTDTLVVDKMSVDKHFSGQNVALDKMSRTKGRGHFGGSVDTVVDKMSWTLCGGSKCRTKCRGQCVLVKQCSGQGMVVHGADSCATAGRTDHLVYVRMSRIAPTICPLYCL